MTMLDVIISEGFIQKRRQRSSLLYLGTEFIQCLAALPILDQDDLQNWMNSSFSSFHPGATNPFFISYGCNSSFSSFQPDAKKLARQGI